VLDIFGFENFKVWPPHPMLSTCRQAHATHKANVCRVLHEGQQL
jgi:hypothetical protein